jgi:hypothetical protein
MANQKFVVSIPVTMCVQVYLEGDENLTDKELFEAARESLGEFEAIPNEDFKTFDEKPIEIEVGAWQSHKIIYDHRFHCLYTDFNQFEVDRI